ncbi:hypothetical protein BLA39750_05673 [Burkholderia lata]|uniref:Uncharacterized protein n=1 Tax=Burkholderia lata (strain ATCC 17760 / DSM 23089 / LMG 22485 / NCIMB 9086 / R18194 / 383) TaxID=482957 RepID=A0A6P3ADH6_BURL3|nr:hypothetical protein [Burkholderia lata]VWD45034.1 hypothetical protein BLA39750_05673 [Burkholderia lata]
MNTPPRSARKTNKDELIKSKLVEYADNPSPQVVEQYSEKLVAILNDLRAHGFDTMRLEGHLVASLRNREEGGYLNYACELSAAGYFSTHYPQHFRYQVVNTTTLNQTSTGTPKTFDFSFVAEGYTFNVEVKAFKPLDLDYHLSTENPVPIGDTELDENPIIDELLALYAALAGESPSQKGRPLKSFLPQEVTQKLHDRGTEFASTRTTSIKRFLKEKANVQLVRPDNGLSVVMLCCNDPDEFADTLTCLVGPYGVCSAKTSSDYETSAADLPNIDAVVVCNLGMNHSAVVDTTRWMKILKDERAAITDGGDFCWDYSKSLPVALLLRPENRSELSEAFAKVFHSHFDYLVETMGERGQYIQNAFFRLFRAAYAVPDEAPQTSAE